MSEDWKGHPFWLEAEAIYQRWKSEEFDIDTQKARQLYYAIWREDRNQEKGFLGGKPKREDERRGPLLDIFTACISDWAIRREGPGWIESARDLIQSYNIVRGNQCLLPGLSIRKELQEREHQIANLSAENTELRNQLKECEKRYQGVWDTNQELEIDNDRLRKEKEGQRAMDIADSMKGKETSKFESDEEGDEKK